MRYTSAKGSIAGVLAALILAVGVTGCASKYEDLKAFTQAHDHDVALARYQVDPPDTIRISSPNVPEIDGVAQRVGVDGKVTLDLLGPVKVSRLTPREIGAKLEDLLKRYYVEPIVEVTVSAYASKKIYVFGEVVGSGALPFTGRDTVLDVLAGSRPRFTAWGSRVKVIRPSPNEDERREIVIDIDKMMETGDLRANFLLQEGDIIYVPPTPWSWVGLRMREILFPVGPLLSGYSTPIRAKSTTDEYDRFETQ